jgi:hypothetical protein
MKTLAILVLFSTIGRAADAAGHWEGKIQMPGRELGITVDLARNPQGAWTGSMSVLGSSAADVPLDELKVQNSAVKFAAYLPDYASFEGNLSEDLSSLSGTVSNALGGVPFQLARKGEANVKLPPANSVLSKDFEGVWEGAIAADGKSRRVRMKLAPASDGRATALLTAVDQGNHEIPVTTVSIEGRQLQVEARAVSGVYRGSLGDNGEIAGEWSEGPNHLPLTFRRAPHP